MNLPPHGELTDEVRLCHRMQALRDDLIAVGFPEAAVAPDDYCEALAASTIGSWRLAGLRFRRAFEPALVLGVRALIWSVRISRRLVAVLSRR